jgi:ubiquinone/menaquinone biosynthesis C-methylase UbiE
MPVIDREDFHTRYAREVADRFHPASILDAGCAFGKTTLAMKRENEEADVIGFDISAPCLKLGHLRANEAGLDVSFVQTLAEDLVLDDATIDVVTGAMLLHELPPPTLRAALREANRVLRPGGHVAYLDFYAVPGAAVGEFFHLGHSRRNNEPFMETLLEMDLEAELIEAGFTNVEIGPFEETDGALTSGDGLPGAWRFPWTLIVAQKPREVV